MNLRDPQERRHTDSGLGFQERGGESVSQKIVFPPEKTGLELDSKEIKRCAWKGEESRRWMEKAKGPRSDLLTRTVPGNVTFRDSSARHHEEPQQGEAE